MHHSHNACWTILRREVIAGKIRVTQVERNFATSLDDCARQYHDRYAHDDRDGTEVTFLKDGALMGVVTITRPKPPVKLVPLEVRI